MKRTLVAVLLLCFSLTVHAEWYEGGTLHTGNGFAWQEATYENKLATVGDFVATLHQRGMLVDEISNSIHSMEDMRFLSNAVVEQLDDFFEPDNASSETHRAIANQSINEAAVMVMVLMGWVSN